jgi:hypothetical protein
MSVAARHRRSAAGMLLLGALCGTAAAQTQTPAPAPAQPTERPTVIVLVGAPGEAQFGDDFAKSADAWADACKRAGVNYYEIGRDAPPPATAPGTTDRQRFQDLLTQEAKGAKQLWIVLIGHGTFDGKEAKFNLRDLDFSDTDLSTWLKPMTRPVALIDGSSASAPFLNRVTGPNRVIITATRSGTEVNYAHFGIFMAAAIANPAADLDRDDQTSLLESFLAAARNLQDFYLNQGRLATEHPLIDDNGDGQGTPAEWFSGLRATRAARQGAALDGARANQWFLIPNEDERKLDADTRARRDGIEQQIESLRQKKASMPESDYYRQLDALLLQLARLLPTAAK